MYAVVCKLSNNAIVALKKEGISDPSGKTEIFKTKSAAERAAAEWIASGLGDASIFKIGKK